MAVRLRRYLNTTDESLHSEDITRHFYAFNFVYTEKAIKFDECNETASQRNDIR
jgi:hypothetical protein